MLNTEEWWHNMFDMHAKLMENQDAVFLREFKKQLDMIPYEYANPYKGLGIGDAYIEDIAGWFDDVSRWSEVKADYVDAEKYLERALDYYCDPTLDCDESIIDEAKERMRNLVENCLLGLYQGCHDIYNE